MKSEKGGNAASITLTRGDLCFAGSFVIGTSRQDGFMHYRNVVCLLAFLVPSA